MSFFGDLLKFAATAALFIATGPFGLSVSAGLATALRIGGTALYALSNLVDKAGVALTKQIISFRTSLQPGTPIPVVYGRAKVGSVIADWFTEPYGNETILYMPVVLCHGSQDGEDIGGVEEIWLNNNKAITTAADVAITSSSVANPTVITTASNHGLATGDWVVIRGHTSVAPSIDGNRQVTVTGVDTFTIPVNVTDGGTGGVVQSDTREHPYATNVVDYRLLLGADDQNVGTTRLYGLRASTSPLLIVIPAKSPTEVLDSAWETTDEGAGLAVISFRMFNLLVAEEPGSSDRKPAFPSGPPNVAAIVSGVRVFDTRTDTWIAGHDNPAMCIRDYLTSPTYGCGFDTTLIDDTSFEDAADYCDELTEFLVGEVAVTSSSVASPSVITTTTAHGFETGQTVRIAGHTSVTPDINGDHTVTVTGTTTFTIPVNVTDGGTGGTATRVVEQKRFTCNGVLDTAQTTASNVQELLSSCRGGLVWEQGTWRLRIRSEDVAAPSVTLGPNQILGQWSFRHAGLEEKYNLAVASYVDPLDGEFKAQQVQWPEIGVSNAYLTEDGDFLNRLDIALPFTNDPILAQAIAQTLLKESRAALSVSMLCTEAALALSVGDRVYVTHPTPGWTAKEFWVTALDLMPNSTVAVSLQEYSAAAYTLETLPKPPGRPTLPSVPADEEGFTPRFKIKNITYAFVGVRLFVSWEGNGASSRIDVSTSGFPAAESGDIVGGSGANYDLGDTTADTYYYITITPYSGAAGTGLPGEPGFLRVLRASASDPGAPTLTGASIADTFGGDSCTESESWTHEIAWTTTSPNDGYYETKIEYADDSGGTNWAALVSGLTTFSSSYFDDTLIAGNTGGSSDAQTFYRKYRVSLIRKSDSATVDGPDSTSQATLTTYSDACA